MNNKTSILTAADCLTADLPAAAALFHSPLLPNGFSGCDTVILNGNHGHFNQQQQPQYRRRNCNSNNGNNNSNNNGLRNMGRKKQHQQQQFYPIDSRSISSTLSSTFPSTPLLFSSPSPPQSLSSSTEIRPPRKSKKCKKNRSGTNPRANPLSPSAISSCSLASIATTSSGLSSSSGASSMGTLNDPDAIHDHPLPSDDVCPNTVIKSSSSSAASSAGFGDMASNDDEDFQLERSNISFFDEPITLDPMQQFNRQWSLPIGAFPEAINNPMPSSKAKNNKRKGNKFSSSSSSNSNYYLSNPAIQQCFFETHQFYRIIYDQNFAALSSTKLLISSSTNPSGDNNNPQKSKHNPERQLSEPCKTNGYLPHQHLGLPPLPPPPETISPWLYHQSGHQQQQHHIISQPSDIIIPSPCEEAFLSHLKLHQIPRSKKLLQPLKQSSTVQNIISLSSNCKNSSDKEISISSPILKTRADFHEQIRERLLAAAVAASSDKIPEENSQTTPIKKPVGKDVDKLKCSLSDAAAIAGVSTPPAPLPQGRLSEDQSLFLQSLPLRRPCGSTSSEPPKHFSTSYASVIQSSSAAAVTPPFAALPQSVSKPTPLNALNLPPLSSLGHEGSPKSRNGSSASSSMKSKKHNGRTFENRRLASTSSSTTSTPQCSNSNGNGKKNNNHKNKKAVAPEFCMKENDFPPISTLSTTSLTKDLSLSSQKGESGYQSEFSTQCSTADCETDSRCSDPGHRNYSSVVANGSKSCADLSDSKDDAISYTEDDCASSLHEDVSRMDLLSEHICDYYEQVSQTERTLLRKLRLRDMLYYSLAPLFPVCGLYVVGSSLNGFGNENSDMDLCLVITNGELDQKNTAVQVLLMVEQTLASLTTVQEQTLIRAKVPILRIKFRGPFSDIVVDLNANNSVAIRNTHLLCYYAFFDWRVRPLVTVVKEWAKQNDINDSTRSTFTSYSLVLMVLHYLQILDDPVLPSLQQYFPKRFFPKADIRTLNLSHPLEEISADRDFKRTNVSSLGTLLIGFFHYYANEYNYEKNAISIRLGREVQRSEVIRGTRQWSPICIEEPFTRSNTAHSIYDEMIFKSVKQKFQDAHEVLSKTWDLSQLLTVQPCIQNSV